MPDRPLVYFSKQSDEWPDPNRCWIIFIPRKWWSISEWHKVLKVKEIIGEL